MTICETCNKLLKDVEELHACDGILYCSRECAIKGIMEDIMQNAKELAIEQYDSNAEVVATADILGDELRETKEALMCELKQSISDVGRLIEKLAKIDRMEGSEDYE